ncbi:MarR family protein [Amantichitinum ursilacus]|uniref:MarR family protein n=2 Tax=Amantichitinum ursilacus TaxID=857265 RepID=A0A0N1JTH3_9NEIS|nr:MarR family protein [Amantichitinum ursilacus]
MSPVARVQHKMVKTALIDQFMWHRPFGPSTLNPDLNSKTVQLNCINAIVRRMSLPTPKSANPELVSLAGELRISLAKLVRRVREQAQQGDFTSSQKSVLLRLERNGASTVSALARAESVRPQSMRVTVAALEAQGAVSGHPDPTDARQTLITLTETFREKVKHTRAIKEDWLLRALQAQLSVDEQTTLASAVQLLQRLAEFEQKD